ncbi:DUF6773 family protein [Lentibacillus salicampi]|uniref:Uncharacterized protein n=1 Tax=Lentibacillus salicampi TaxID=175306 RepID=A0A4Y9A8X1_9BACI|nr:DUF6773 family protein [Lentibacillus salicampi]TFJ91885.1 hypothetical protein E4U82_15310 [Lentibacillus salicampi]
MFSRKNHSKDERITTLENKIYKEIYILVVVICVISAAIKFYQHGFHIEAAFTEWAIFLATGIYFSYRSVKLGLYSDEVEMHDRTNKMSREKKNLIVGAVIGAVGSFGIALNSTISYVDGVANSIFNFILVFFVSIIFYVPFLVFMMIISHTIMKKKSDKAVAKQLEDMDEDGDDDEKH